MKIIKNGNLEKSKQIKRFKCDNCGCVFEVEKGEYKYMCSPRNEDVYKCKCPYCNKETSSEVVMRNTQQSQLEFLGY